MLSTGPSPWTMDHGPWTRATVVDRRSGPAALSFPPSLQTKKMVTMDGGGDAWRWNMGSLSVCALDPEAALLLPICCNNKKRIAVPRFGSYFHLPTIPALPFPTLPLHSEIDERRREVTRAGDERE